MASTPQTLSDQTLIGPFSEHFEENAKRYAFFQVVEILQSNLDKEGDIGSYERASEERIVFNVTPKLSFPTSDVVSITPLMTDDLDAPEKQEGRFRVTVSFLGLHGSNSPLPSYYPEQIAQQSVDGGVTKGLLDFFHSRIIGLFHRAWRKYRYYRRYKPGGQDPFSGWIFSCFGLMDERIRSSSRIYWPRLLCFAGILSTRNRSPAVLANVISRAFNLKDIDIEEWVYRKVTIPKDQLWSLSGANSQLGKNTILGDRAPDIQGKIRIVLNELDYKRFRDFLPHGADFKPLCNLVEFMLRDQFAYDLKLGLSPNEAHPLTLGKNELGRLGWSSFLGSGQADIRRDVIIQARL